jgi:YhcH/YjgK/YiaL family protein
MIIDHISNSALYYGISKNLEKGLKFIQETDFSSLEVGKYTIDGDNVFALVQQHNGKEINETKFEGHKNYIDIQYIVKGKELMGYAPIEDMEVINPYNVEKDVLFLKWEGTLLPYNEGMFSIFFPQDAHMPNVKAFEGTVKKVVVKVKIR